jgi:GNAT superfamily N-acetyltransferase
MVDVTYISGNERLMDQIAPLWEELNRLHLRLSTYFRDYYEASTFEDRKRALQQRTCGGELRVDLALDVSKQPIGYCVTSIDQWLTGEIESLFVNPQNRGQGIGTTLMEKALDWLNVKGAKRNIVAVAVGNEQVYGFYEHFSFLPRRTLLEQKKQVESK